MTAGSLDYNSAVIDYLEMKNFTYNILRHFGVKYRKLYSVNLS